MDGSANPLTANGGKEGQVRGSAFAVLVCGALPYPRVPVTVRCLGGRIAHTRHPAFFERAGGAVELSPPGRVLPAYLPALADNWSRAARRGSQSGLAPQEAGTCPRWLWP